MVNPGKWVPVIDVSPLSLNFFSVFPFSSISAAMERPQSIQLLPGIIRNSDKAVWIWMKLHKNKISIPLCTQLKWSAFSIQWVLLAWCVQCVACTSEWAIIWIRNYFLRKKCMTYYVSFICYNLRLSRKQQDNFNVIM